MPFRLAALACLIVALATPAAAWAIVTDRPDVAESSLTVPALRFQLESGVDINFADTVLGETVTQVRFPTKLRFGLTDTLEAHLEGGVLESDFLADQTQSERADFAVGGKINLYNGAPSLPSIGFLTAFELPFKPENDLFTWRNTLALDHRLLDWLSISVNVFYVVQLNDRELNNTDSFGAAASLGWGLLQRYDIGVYTEVFGSRVFDDSEAGIFFDGGLTYTLSEQVQFDLYGRTSLGNDTQEIGFGSGIGVLF